MPLTTAYLRHNVMQCQHTFTPVLCVESPCTQGIALRHRWRQRTRHHNGPWQLPLQGHMHRPKGPCDITEITDANRRTCDRLASMWLWLEGLSYRVSTVWPCKKGLCSKALVITNNAWQQQVRRNALHAKCDHCRCQNAVGTMPQSDFGAHWVPED